MKYIKINAIKFTRIRYYIYIFDFDIHEIISNGSQASSLKVGQIGSALPISQE